MVRQASQYVGRWVGRQAGRHVAGICASRSAGRQAGSWAGSQAGRRVSRAAGSRGLRWNGDRVDYGDCGGLRGSRLARHGAGSPYNPQGGLRRRQITALGAVYGGARIPPSGWFTAAPEYRPQGPIQRALFKCNFPSPSSNFFRTRDPRGKPICHRATCASDSRKKFGPRRPARCQMGLPRCSRVRRRGSR